jgi:hypothetical protein
VVVQLLEAVLGVVLVAGRVAVVQQAVEQDVVGQEDAGLVGVPWVLLVGAQPVPAQAAVVHGIEGHGHFGCPRERSCG